MSLLKDSTDPLPPKPSWWPECPYPKTIFPMTEEDYVEAVPDPKLRTALSGCLGRHFWNLAEEEIWRRWIDHLDEMKGTRVDISC